MPETTILTGAELLTRIKEIEARVSSVVTDPLPAVLPDPHEAVNNVLASNPAAAQFVTAATVGLPHLGRSGIALGNEKR